MGLPKISWTQAMDDQIRMLRQQGASWDAIAAQLGFNRNTIIMRAREIPGLPKNTIPRGRSPKKHVDTFRNSA